MWGLSKSDTKNTGLYSCHTQINACFYKYQSQYDIWNSDKRQLRFSQKIDDLEKLFFFFFLIKANQYHQNPKYISMYFMQPGESTATSAFCICSGLGFFCSFVLYAFKRRCVLFHRLVGRISCMLSKQFFGKLRNKKIPWKTNCRSIKSKPHCHPGCKSLNGMICNKGKRRCLFRIRFCAGLA